jgi:8-oxo-dGTP pyrophosphatase MutT (NUDIX family)
MDEKCDIVDKYDRVVGAKLRNEISSEFVSTRYVNILIRNSKGEFWIPSRRDDLKRWPSGPDFAVGGAVLSGEDYINAALREAGEEIGGRVTSSQLNELAYISPYKYPVACFMKVYELMTDNSPGILPSEYKSARWFKLDELLQQLIANELPTKTDLLPVIRLCYGALEHTDKSLLEP